MRRLLPSFLFSLLIALPLTAQVEVSMSLDSSVMLIGDQLRLSLGITAPAGTEIVSLNYRDWEEGGNVEIVDLGEMNTVTENPRLLLQQEIQLTSFDSGYHLLPPLEVIYQLNGITDTTFSKDLGLEVRTLPVPVEANILDNKDIQEEARNWRDFLPYIIGLWCVLIIGGIIWWLSQRKRIVPEPPPPPPIPPHITAREKLAELEAAASWEKGEIKPFQSELTYILREYLEGRFDLQALEATTPEIKAQLVKLDLTGDWTDRLHQLLQTADMVKFAKAIPPVEVHPQGLTTVRDFVEDTMIREVPKSDENDEHVD